MTKDELVSVLEMITLFSYEYLKSLPIEKLEQIYEERHG